MLLLGEARSRKVAILGAILLLATIHWLVPKEDKHIHNLLYHLDFIPIVAAGMMFGWRSAVIATLITGAFGAEQIGTLWRDEPFYAMDQAGETMVYGVAGILVGLMASRERRQRTNLEKTKGELEQVYLELRKNLEHLKKADRMVTVAQLSAGLAHEIRNPLAGISGAAGILKRGHANPENVRECIEIIEKETQRLNELLTHFLDFARTRTPRFRPTDVAEVMDSVIALAGHSPGASMVELRKETEGVLPDVECDPEQLKQVLLNLVINAIQATREGTVWLRASVRKAMLNIAVQDQGSGITLEERERIFDPFFTTKESGTGLGLAIASKIVEQHGGTLRAENAPSGGLTMVVELPLRRRPVTV